VTKKTELSVFGGERHDRAELRLTPDSPFGGTNALAPRGQMSKPVLKRGSHTSHGSWVNVEFSETFSRFSLV